MKIWEDGPVNALVINLDEYAEKTDFVEFSLTFALGKLFFIYCELFTVF